jgi:hypothetical protein
MIESVIGQNCRSPPWMIRRDRPGLVGSELVPSRVSLKFLSKIPKTNEKAFPIVKARCVPSLWLFEIRYLAAKKVKGLGKKGLC